MFSYGFLIDLQLSIIALWAVYFLIIHRRVSIKVSRIFLLLILPSAFCLSFVKVPIFTYSNPTVTLEYPSPTQTLEQPLYENDVHGQKDAIEQAIVVPTGTMQQSELLSIGEILWWGYLMGVILMFVWTVASAIQLIFLIRKSPKETIYGRELIFTKKHISACSFFGYIIINESYRDSQWLRAVILHEEYHSRCHHTLDLIYMITVRTILWFNPVSWHMMKLIRQVHEYEVDRNVVESGESLSDYMTLLINSNFKKNPTLCNSLGYSITKKRLLMLTKNYSKFSSLRIMAVAPVMAILICAFVLTAKAETTEAYTLEAEMEQSQQPQQSEQSQLVQESQPSAQPTVEPLQSKDSVVHEYKGSITYSPSPVSATHPQTQNEPEVKDNKSSISSTHNIMYTTILPATDNLPEIVLNYDNKNFPRIFKKIVGVKLDRRLVVSIPDQYISSVVKLNGNIDNNGVRIRKSSDKAILVTIKSGISYQSLCDAVLAEGGNFSETVVFRNNAINSKILIRRHNGKTITVRYPLSHEYSKLVSRINKDYIKDIQQINAFKAIAMFGVSGINGVTLVNLKPFEGGLIKVMPTINASESAQLIRWRDRYAHYEIQPSQIKIARKPISGNEDVLRIRHTETETIVTIGYRIYYNSNWIAPNQNQVMEDVKTGDRYCFRRIDGGVPTGIVLIFNDCQNKVVELDHVFPRLADDVEEVVLYDAAESNYDIPLNGTSSIKKRIRIADYINKNPGKDIY